MKQKIISLFVAAVMAILQVHAGVTLSVPDVNITAGGTSNVVIYFNLGAKAYTAYQFDITYPEGISSVSDVNGNPAFTKGEVYTTEHAVSSLYNTSKGLDRFQCFSVNSLPFTAQSGTLLILPIKAQKNLEVGTYQATISPIEFVQTDATPDRPDAITFNIKVSNSVVLDETSITPPTDATGVNVRVLRTIKANEWSTICLPFAMTEAQVKTAFGDDVELGNFTGYETVEDIDENIVGIKVNFSESTTIEANHPYIIKVSSAVLEFSVNGVDIHPEEYPTVAAVKRTKKQWSEMIGTYVANTTIEESCLFLNDNKFWYSKGATRMKAFGAYFAFYDVLTSVENAAARISMDFDENETTGIRNQKSVDNLRGIYDLQGRYVSKPSKGLYIQNGMKRIIK